MKYVGVLLDCKKLKVNSCMLVIDRITSRMRHWSSRLLSYAGRAKLITSVVISIVTYWLHIFPLPNRILKYIKSICRSLLWSGKEVVVKKALIAWEKVCQANNSGGLNIIDVCVCVEASTLLYTLMGFDCQI